MTGKSRQGSVSSESACFPGFDKPHCLRLELSIAFYAVMSKLATVVLAQAESVF